MYITPTHINKYVNCPYKWHYETKYTKKELNDMYQEYKIDNGITSNKQFQAFKKGNTFHAEFLKREKRKNAISALLITIILILGALSIWTTLF